MTKFKSFPTTVYTRKLEPIIRGTGPNVRYDQAIPALAYYTVLTTVFGYLGLLFKNTVYCVNRIFVLIVLRFRF